MTDHLEIPEIDNGQLQKNRNWASPFKNFKKVKAARL
jgi:hypothetical protein